MSDTNTEQVQPDPEPEKAPDQVKCDNHPDRDAVTYTLDGRIAPINLCEECTPSWFKN
jgi:hypothetical protein